jgi:protein gp37
VLKSKTKFYDPLKWKEPKLIFTCSWSDWFIEEGDQWREELWEIIKATPHHTYQILTKRPERIKDCLPPDWGKGYDNVWLGASVGTNESLKRCEILNEIPAKVKFISAEPLLEDLTELNEVLIRNKFDWCIIGGESGNNTGKYRFRECKLEWINNIIKACNDTDVKVFVKQLGTFLGKAMRLKDSHGGDMKEWPNEIQIREFPVSFEILSNEKRSAFTVSKKVFNNNQIEKLSPFKALLAKAIIAGEDPIELATRISIERKIPRPTAKAYVTMVQKLFLKKSSVCEKSLSNKLKV